MILRRTQIIVALAILISGHCYGQSMSEIGDIESGRMLAAKECTDCHKIDRSHLRPQPIAAAPDFVDIANTPGVSPTSLFVFLHTSHLPMPNIILTREESLDVIAYILALRKPAK